MPCPYRNSPVKNSTNHDGDRFQTIIRSFKSAVTKAAHDAGLFSRKTIWQSRFYDHIVRSDTDHYYITSYIQLNPLLWYLDLENPEISDDETNLETIRKVMHDELHLDPVAIEYVIENEISGVAKGKCLRIGENLYGRNMLRPYCCNVLRDAA